MKKKYVTPVTECFAMSLLSMVAATVKTKRYYQDPETGEWIEIVDDSTEEPEEGGTLGKGTSFDLWDSGY